MPEDSANTLSILSYLGSWFATTGIIYKVSEQVDKVASAEAKKVTSYWLHKSNAERLFKGAFYSIDKVFDKVFGKKHISWRTFTRSALASTTSILLILLFGVGIGWQSTIVNGNEDYQFVAGGFIINIFIDYISLLETRYVLKLLTHVTSRVKTFLLMIVDFFSLI